jgi:hypothetical protein
MLFGRGLRLTLCIDSHTIPSKIEFTMKVEVRASGLRDMGQKRDLTQRQLAKGRLP